MSTSGLELSNKQLRAGIRNRSYRGNIDSQITDALNHGYLSGSRAYKLVVGRDVERILYRCGICKATTHRRRNCPTQIDPEIIQHMENHVSDDEDEDMVDMEREADTG